MATWLIVLLCLPPVLWFVYCMLRFALGLSLCAHCIFGWTMGAVALGLWMVLSGLSEGVERRVVLGATIVITFAIAGGVVFLVSRLGAQRAHRNRTVDKVDAAADTAVIAGTAALAAGVVSRERPEGTPDGAPDGATEPDLDLDIGLDV